jgi:tetratricopeptide (TPR) repeat protein
MMGDFEAAFSYYARALPLSREVGNLYNETYQLINLSATSGVRHEAAASLEYSQKALELAKKTGDRSAEAWTFLYMGYAFLLQDEFERAEQSFRESIAIRHELGQPGLETEPMAGLIQIYLQKGDPASASVEAQKIVSYLQTASAPLEGTEDPLRVYYACYEALESLEDPRAKEVLRAAAELLDQQVSRLRDENSRQMFIENVPWRKAIRQAWQKRT